MAVLRQCLLGTVLAGLPGCAAAVPAADVPSSREVAQPSSAPPPTLTPDQQWAELDSIERAPELDVRYLACARRRGFDPGSVQVLAAPSGAARYVKTSYEVPADVHGPCLAELGGTDSGRTSYGNPQGG